MKEAYEQMKMRMLKYDRLSSGYKLGISEEIRSALHDNFEDYVVSRNTDRIALIKVNEHGKV